MQIYRVSQSVSEREKEEGKPEKCNYTFVSMPKKNEEK